MSADLIQTNYEELETIASRFQQRAEVITELYNRLQRCVQELEEGDWEGKGSDAFFTEMHTDIYPAVQRLSTALDEAGNVTLAVKDLIRQAEEEASAIFQGNPIALSPSTNGKGDGGGVWDKVGEWVHGGLDLLGLVPGFGEAADGINGLIYLAEGRELEAGLSFAAMIPFAGWGATGAKVGLRVGREVLEEGIEEGAERIIREGTEGIVERGTREGADDVAGGITRIADDPPATITVASGHKSVRDPSFLKFDDLTPNSAYRRNNYEYVTDTDGRVAQVSGELRLEPDTPRYRDYETQVGNAGLDADHGGHIIGNRFGGTSEGVNLVPQNGNFNQGAYNQLETQWADEVARGKRVEVNIQLQYPRGSNRPDSYNIEYTITDPDTGIAKTTQRLFRNRPGGR